jgi:TatD DNase family protein
MMLIDTHCHLNFKAFKKNFDNVLWQAQVAGIKKIIVPGADITSSRKAVELARSYHHLYAAVGIHPHHVIGVKDSAIQELKELAQRNKVVAIGECGLDYHPYKKTKYEDYKIDKNFKKKQKEIFINQLKIAKEVKLPIIIHCREAHLDIKKTINLKKIKGLKGVFHCFSGDKRFLKWVLAKGFYVGFDGNITYDKNLQVIVKIVPLGKILLETDAPFLTPEPLRTKKIFPNKPENVRIVADAVARLKGKSFLEVCKKTTHNAQQLFGFV